MYRATYFRGVIVQPDLFEPGYTVYKDGRSGPQGPPKLGRIEVSGPLLSRTFTATDLDGREIGQTGDFEAAITLFTD